MKDLKIMTGIVYFCAVGVVASLAGGIYTAVVEHRERSKPQSSVFPLPAGDSSGAPVPQQRDGGLPTPAQ